MAKKVEVIYTLVDRISRNADKIQRRIDKLEKSLARVDKQMNKFGKDNSFQKFATKTSASVDKLDKRFKKLDTTTANLSKKLDTLNKRMETQNRQAEKYVKTAQKQEKAFRTLDRAAGELNTEYARLNQTGRSLNPTLVRTNRNIQVQADRFTKATHSARGFLNMLEKIERMEGRVAEVMREKNSQAAIQRDGFIGIDRSSRQAARGMDMLTRSSNSYWAKAKKHRKDNNVFGQGFQSGLGQIGALRKLAAIAPVVSVGLAGVGGMINGITVGVMGLAGSITRLASAAALLPGIYSAIGVSSVAGKGIAGVLEKAMEKQKGELANAWKLRKAVEGTKAAWEGLWNGQDGKRGIQIIRIAVRSLNRMTKVLKTFDNEAQMAVNVFWTMDSVFRKLTNNSAFMKDLHEFVQGALANTKKLVQLFEDLAPIVAVIGIEVNDFTGRIIDSAGAWLKSKNNAEELAKIQGSIHDFLVKGEQSLYNWLDIIGNLGSGLATLVLPGAQAFEEHLKELSAAFDSWATKVEGNGSLAKFNENGLEVLKAMEGVIVAIGGVLGRIGTSDKATTAIVDFLDTLSSGITSFGGFALKAIEDLGPSLTNLFKAMGEAPKGTGDMIIKGIKFLVDSMTSMVELINKMPGGDKIFAFLTVLSASQFIFGSVLGGLASVVAAFGTAGDKLLEIANRLKGNGLGKADKVGKATRAARGIPGAGVLARAEEFSAQGVFVSNSMRNPVPVVVVAGGGGLGGPSVIPGGGPGKGGKLGRFGKWLKGLGVGGAGLLATLGGKGKGLLGGLTSRAGGLASRIGLGGLGARIGSKLIPGVGWGSLLYEAGNLEQWGNKKLAENGVNVDIGDSMPMLGPLFDAQEQFQNLGGFGELWKQGKKGWNGYSNFMGYGAEEQAPMMNNGSAGAVDAALRYAQNQMRLQQKENAFAEYNRRQAKGDALNSLPGNMQPDFVRRNADAATSSMKKGTSKQLQTLNSFSAGNTQYTQFHQRQPGMVGGSMNAANSAVAKGGAAMNRTFGATGQAVTGTVSTWAGKVKEILSGLGAFNNSGGNVNISTDPNKQNAGSILNNLNQGSTPTQTSLNPNVMSFGTGTPSVPGDPSKGDVVPAMLTGGEMVLNQQQQASLGSLLNGHPMVNAGLIPFIQKAVSLGGVVTSTTDYKHATGSLHYSGNAVDLGGSAGVMSSIFHSFEPSAQSGALAELFYDPPGYSYDNGQRIGPIGGHGDHVHAGLGAGAALFGTGGSMVPVNFPAVPNMGDGLFAQAAESATENTKKLLEATYQTMSGGTTTGGPMGSFTGGGSPDANRALGQQMASAMGWSGQWPALLELWNRESGWDHLARNQSSGAYGIPQSLPAEKMASAGPDWLTNPATQIKWGLGYIAGRYGNPAGALAHHNSHNWYGEGGDFIAKSPQLIGVGDKDERVTITPKHKDPVGYAGGRGGTTIHSSVTISGVVVADDAGIEKLSDMIGEKISQSVRQAKGSNFRG